MPRPYAPIQFPRKGRRGQKGFTEPAFGERLDTYFLRQRNLQVYADRFLFISNGTQPYEPDFTIIDETNGLNLFIDIEIDEPYDGTNRNATHFLGSDDYRNKFFIDRGWVVIRFSERQIHLNPMGCCYFIAQVIRSLNNNFTIPQALLAAEVLTEEPFWTKVQAEKWAKMNYRENYLGITEFAPKKSIIIVPDDLFINENELEFSKRVAPSTEEKAKTKGKLSKINEHSRDRRIQFYPGPHLYLIDDNPKAIPVSTLVKRFFPDFDGEYWANRNAARDGLTPEQLLIKWENDRKDAADRGTGLHLNIEQFFETGSGPVDKIEFNHFLKLYDSKLKHLKAYRTEWRIFDDLLYIAGTLDMVFKKDDGTYAIYDWKRSKDIKMNNSYNTGFGPCSTLEDCNFNHYCLQINIYKRILKDYYAKQVSEMKMVQLHPNFPDYRIFEIPNMQDEVNRIYEALM